MGTARRARCPIPKRLFCSLLYGQKSHAAQCPPETRPSRNLKVVGGEREIVCLKFVDTIVFGRVSSEYPVHLKTTKSLVLQHFLPSRSSFPYEICLVQLAGGRSRSLYCCHYSQMSIIVDGKRGTKKLFFAASIFLAVHALRSSKEDLGSR